MTTTFCLLILYRTWCNDCKCVRVDDWEWLLLFWCVKIMSLQTLTKLVRDSITACKLLQSRVRTELLCPGTRCGEQSYTHRTYLMKSMWQHDWHNRCAQCARHDECDECAVCAEHKKHNRCAECAVQVFYYIDRIIFLIKMIVFNF